MTSLVYDTVKETKLIPPVEGIQIHREAFDTAQKKLEEINAIHEAEAFFND